MNRQERLAEFERLVRRWVSAGDRREWDEADTSEQALEDFGAVRGDDGGWVLPDEPSGVAGIPDDAMSPADEPEGVLYFDYNGQRFRAKVFARTIWLEAQPNGDNKAFAREQYPQVFDGQAWRLIDLEHLAEVYMRAWLAGE